MTSFVFFKTNTLKINAGRMLKPVIAVLSVLLIATPDYGQESGESNPPPFYGIWLDWQESGMKESEGTLHAWRDEDEWIVTEWIADESDGQVLSFRTVVTADRAMLVSTEVDERSYVVMQFRRKEGKIIGQGIRFNNGTTEAVELYAEDPWTELLADSGTEQSYPEIPQGIWTGKYRAWVTSDDAPAPARTLVFKEEAEIRTDEQRIHLVSHFNHPSEGKRYFTADGLWDGRHCIIQHQGNYYAGESILLWGDLDAQHIDLEGSLFWQTSYNCLSYELDYSGAKDNATWAAAWLKEIEQVETNLPELHLNLFHTLSREQWKQGCQNLKQLLPRNDDITMRWGLSKLLASVREGHTQISYDYPFGEHFLPFTFDTFHESWFITQTYGNEWHWMNGYEIISIAGRQMDILKQDVAPLIFYENDAWLTVKCAAVMRNIDALASLDLIEPGTPVNVILRDPATGESIAVEVGDMTAGELALMRTKSPFGDRGPAMSFHNPEKPFWYAISDDRKVLYFQWNACLHPQEPYNQYYGIVWPVESFFEEVESALKHGKYEKVIIDLRYNTGGSSMIGSRFISHLRKIRAINKSNVLKVLVGRETYSSGLIHACELNDNTQAVLLGQNTGGKPHSFGNIRIIRLDNAAGSMIYSTKYLRLTRRYMETLSPDIVIPVTHALYSEGRDEVMENILGIGWEHRFSNTQE